MKNQLFGLASLLFISTISLAQVKDALPPSYKENQSNKSEVYRAEAEKIHDLVHTKLDLKFDWEKEQVNGEAWITLKPHFYSTNKLTLDAKAMLIHDVELVKGNAKSKLKFTNDDQQLFIDLDKTYKRNEEYTLYIKYTARPNEVKQAGSAAITDAKGMYFINAQGTDPDKPTQVWTQGETESSSCWFPTIDKPNQKTSQEMYLTVPDKYITLSNGKLEKQTKNSDGTRTDYWNFKQKHAPYLFFVGIGDYAIVKDKWKNLEVNYYVEHEYEPYAKQIFGNTPEMIGFFSDLLKYEFPWNKYHQISARDYVSGAMENTTAVIFAEGVQQKPGQLIDENTWEGTIAHELFHHWFGDLVTTESWGNLTVNESLANYSEYLWFEHKFGKDKAEEDRYDDLQGYKMDPNNFNKNLVRVHYEAREDMFDGVSYNKGGKGVLHMLRSYLGDEAFFGGLSKYLHDYEYGTAEAVQIRLAMEAVSGRDLNWFFDQWYFGNGHPQLNIAYDYNASTKKVKVTLVQTQSKLFEFPFAIDVVIDGKASRQNVWVAKKKENSFEFDASKSPDVVIPNANQDILCDIKETKSTEAFAAQYKVAKDEFTSRLLALENLANAQATNETALNTLVSALNDSYEGIRIFAINKLDGKDAKVKSKANSILKKLANADPKTKVQAAALNKLNEMGESDLGVFQNGLKSQSFSVQAASASGVLRLDPTKTQELAKLSDEVLATNPELIAELLPIWMANNDTSKLNVAAESVAFYLFTKYEDPALGTKLEPGFAWVLGSDDMKSTQKVASLYKQVYKYYGKENPSLGMMFRNLLDQAISLKVKANQTAPSKGLEEQIQLLTDTKDALK
ncbi:M1 family metallopeptidase [Moheibacter lacus]|uniref:Aminopeptidase N n=1 Tax=Moheibacter lacus TaxID=2745851 RepID=A0A838ZQE7_9FLAO|nr:M1 family metallopeptidase [Moheibacter lacus]MBA5629375.1 M1 family metallopeptidase [Moheibacter lacus]